MNQPLVEVDRLTTVFRGRRTLGRPLGADIRAVDGVSFAIVEGESYALVGESGCGKSTTGRSLLRLVEPTGGTVTFDGIDVRSATSSGLRALRRQMQMVFQDPYSALNPRMRIQDIVAEPLVVHGLARGAAALDQARAILDHCGLPASAGARFPSEFSGGQRALVTKPRFIVADEPVSALDVSIQAQILNLLQDLQAEFRLTYLFISHDLAVVRTVSDRVAVMYLGQIVEEAETRRFFAGPRHPYSQALLSSVPREHPRQVTNRTILTGVLPSAADPPPGCRFHTRCPLVTDRCRTEAPLLRPLTAGHRVACHLEEG
jgi:oligopeptide/dipeptide ABC transporter ATP-binding protein